MYKKIIAVLLAVLMAISCFFMVGCGGKKEEVEEEAPANAQEEIEKSDFLYPEKNEDFRYNKYTYYVAITQCLSLKSNIVVPDTIDNLPVYEIAPSAFANQTTIKSVSISDKIINIGAKAFNNCPQLASVKLPSGLLTLGEDAFAKCTMLRDIELPNTLAFIPDGAFSGCESLSYAIIDEPELISVDKDTGEELYTTARTVGEGAFSQCPNLRYIWFSSDCSFSDGNNMADPLSGSIENLVVYGYSQSDAARYAADNFVDFTLIQNKSQLVEFKSTARNASKIQTLGKDENYKGEELEIQIENVYVVRNDIDYYVMYEQNKEFKAYDYKYTPAPNTSVIFFGIKVKNNTSKAISFNTLNSSITVDSYAGRFANFGTLQTQVLSKYASPYYKQIDAGNTDYIYFASIVNSDWEEIVINFGNYSELLNYNFTIKSTDNITYIGSSQTAIDEEITTSTPEGTTTPSGEEESTVPEESTTNSSPEETTTAESSEGTSQPAERTTYIVEIIN